MGWAFYLFSLIHQMSSHLASSLTAILSWSDSISSRWDWLKFIEWTMVNDGIFSSMQVKRISASHLRVSSRYTRKTASHAWESQLILISVYNLRVKRTIILSILVIIVIKTDLLNGGFSIQNDFRKSFICGNVLRQLRTVYSANGYLTLW